MTPEAIVVGVLAGLLIGVSLGALGGGGSILAVPVLAFGMSQDAVQATTGALVVVAISAAVSALAAWRAGNVLPGRGLSFGAVAILGAVFGAHASTQIDGNVLLAAFAVLMLAVGGLMAYRQRHPLHEATVDHTEPIIRFSPSFACQCPRAAKVLLTATAVGLLTGFLGVGGGFLVVPALVLALGLPLRTAAGTSLVVITLTSVSALLVRVGVGSPPDWAAVGLLAGTAVVGGVLGARLASRTETARLSQAFTVLVLVVAVYTAARAFPALL